MRSIILAGVSAMALTFAGGALAAQNAAQNPAQNPTPPSAAENAGTSSMQNQAAMKNEANEPAAEVKQAQEKLKSENLYKGRVDGILGPETQHALKQFQQQNNLQQTGQLDDQTEQKLGITEQTGSGSSQPSGSSATHH
jgi:peptidoglycan hydrolase-like protein with peptidoglycan-binding domain